MYGGGIRVRNNKLRDVCDLDRTWAPCVIAVQVVEKGACDQEAPNG